MSKNNGSYFVSVDVVKETYAEQLVVYANPLGDTEIAVFPRKVIQQW